MSSALSSPESDRSRFTDLLEGSALRFPLDRAKAAMQNTCSLIAGSIRAVVQHLRIPGVNADALVHYASSAYCAANGLEMTTEYLLEGTVPAVSHEDLVDYVRDSAAEMRHNGAAGVASAA